MHGLLDHLVYWFSQGPHIHKTMIRESVRP